jgi:hypothetical protein
MMHAATFSLLKPQTAASKCVGRVGGLAAALGISFVAGGLSLGEAAPRDTYVEHWRCIYRAAPTQVTVWTRSAYWSELFEGRGRG